MQVLKIAVYNLRGWLQFTIYLQAFVYQIQVGIKNISPTDNMYIFPQ